MDVSYTYTTPLGLATWWLGYLEYRGPGADH